MKHWIEDRANEAPDKIAIIQDERKLTNQELFDQAKMYAYFFKQLNQKRIGLYIKNDIEHVALIIGAWLENIEVVMINTKLTASEIENQLQTVDVDIVLSYQALNIKQQVKLIEDIVLQDRVNETYTLDLNHIATIMFTSGTTGPAKAVPQTFSNHYYSAVGCKETLGYDQSTNWLSVLPIYHISGLSVLIRSLIFGFKVILEPKFEAKRVMNMIKSDNITHLSLVPQTLQWLMDDGLDQPYQLEKILLGGAKLSDKLIQDSLNKNLPIYNSFGMTETCSQFVTASPEMLAEKPRTVGKIASNVKLKIINQDNNGHGEIIVSGGNVMNGYLTSINRDQDFVDGYFKTGDVGSIDEEGFVYIYDRRKDLIISGGENIYPYEIEHTILNHQDVINCVAVPVNDEKWGQVPALAYEADHEIDIEAFQALLNKHLAKYKHPKYFCRIDAIPRTSTGKVSRHKVKAWIEHEAK
nr:o-succinylbenzoate--CoA ligase [Mammaliicoccus sp. Marseille-Q6498]